jgi:hypothetical protein
MTTHAVINVDVNNIPHLKNIIDKVDMNLICSTGKYFGKKYYAVKPIGYINWSEMELWCQQTFGKMGNIWDAKNPYFRWTANDAKFWFIEEKDREWFILRWS